MGNGVIFAQQKKDKCIFVYSDVFSFPLSLGELVIFGFCCQLFHGSPWPASFCFVGSLLMKPNSLGNFAQAKYGVRNKEDPKWPGLRGPKRVTKILKKWKRDFGEKRFWGKKRCV